jgi:hypothetical protein
VSQEAGRGHIYPIVAISFYSTDLPALFKYGYPAEIFNKKPKQQEALVLVVGRTTSLPTYLPNLTSIP